jgi:hypothetical protein
MTTTLERCAGLYPPLPSNFVDEDPMFLAKIVSFALLIAAGLTIGISVLSRKHKRTTLDYILLFYFSLSCPIHLVFERYWVHNNARIPDFNNTDAMARIWRTNSISDTRWLGPQEGIPRSQYSCMYGLEFIAAYLCGPMSVLTLILYFFNNPIRYVVQTVFVVAQAYGLLITWLPQYFEGHTAVPVSDKFLFYGLYIATQSPWLIFPIITVIQSCWTVAKMKIAPAAPKGKQGKKQKTK